MALWSNFYPLILGHVLGCPDPLMDQELRLSAQEFCRRTKCWLVWLDPVTTVSGNAEYDFDTPLNSTVVRVERANIGNTPVEIRSFRACESDPAIEVDGNDGFISSDRMTFRLGSAATAGQSLSVQVLLMPGDRAAGVPDELFRQYAEQIGFGAKARLMEIPGQTWTNPGLSDANREKFNAAIGAVAVDSWRGNTQATPRSRISWC